MKRFFTLFTLALLFPVSNLYSQDYSYEIVEEAKTDYERTNIVYSIAEVAEKLGVNATVLGNALEAWKPTEEYATPRTNLFCLIQPGGVENTTPTASWGGYYLDKTGTLSYWGTEGYWFVHPDWDLEAGELYLCVGQNPTKPLLPGETVRCTIAMDLNNARVTFDIALTIKASEGIDKEPTTALSKLEIVGRTTYEHTQAPNTEWYNEPNEVAVPGMAEALGIDPDYFAKNMKYIIYAKKFDNETLTWSDQLVNSLTATPTPGFWFGSGVQFENDEVESEELQHADWGDTDKFWVASLAYADDVISCTIGQYAYAPWQLGERHNAEIYFIYGNKAWVINFVLTVDVNLDDVIDNYTKVGSKEYEFNRDPRDGWTTLSMMDVDMADVFEKLGAESMDDIRVAANDQYGALTSEYTADAPGFWFLPDGAVTGYSGGTASFYVNYVDSVKQFQVGNMPNAFKGGETCLSSMYFIKDNNYYEFTFLMTMDSPMYTIENCVVEERDLVVKMVPTEEGGAWEIGQTDMSALEAELGTSSGLFYGVDAEGALTNTYSVSEANGGATGGGFWMSAENQDHYAYAASYSGEGAFALWYYESTIHWFNIPGFRKPGEFSTATFYIYNLWDGKAFKLNTTLQFVSEVEEEVSTVGEEDIVLPGRNMETNDYYELVPDLTACCTALGCSVEELIDNGEWLAKNTDGKLTNDDYDFIYGLTFDENGAVTADVENAAFTFGFSEENTFRAYVVNEEDLEKVFHTVLYVKYNTAYYAFNVTIGKEDTGIQSTISNLMQSKRIYDLSGRVVEHPTKGIYISNGKKFLVK